MISLGVIINPQQHNQRMSQRGLMQSKSCSNLHYFADYQPQVLVQGLQVGIGAAEVLATEILVLAFAGVMEVAAAPVMTRATTNARTMFFMDLVLLVCMCY